jgi:hypothetical protein
MDRAQLLAELADAGTQPGDGMFVERRGEDNQWSRRMCGAADRCRWPLDQPYPPGH